MEPEDAEKAGIEAVLWKCRCDGILRVAAGCLRCQPIFGV